MPIRDYPDRCCHFWQVIRNGLFFTMPFSRPVIRLVISWPVSSTIKFTPLTQRKFLPVPVPLLSSKKMSFVVFAELIFISRKCFHEGLRCVHRNWIHQIQDMNITRYTWVDFVYNNSQKNVIPRYLGYCYTEFIFHCSNQMYHQNTFSSCLWTQQVLGQMDQYGRVIVF